MLQGLDMLAKTSCLKAAYTNIKTQVSNNASTEF